MSGDYYVLHTSLGIELTWQIQCPLVSPDREAHGFSSRQQTPDC